ncbi:MAG: CDP-glycerol glycerophosphotransferase family protein, partial [Rhodanobacteraceae bacterium]
MFDARLPRELGSLALSWLGSLLGWLLIAPFAALVPKRRDWIAVIGRQHGKFLDNAKYFHLQAGSQATGLRVVFISERADVVAPVRASGLQALRYPGLAAAWYLARCGCAVADSTDWGRRLRRFLLIRARTVQLWHGVGFKRIELDKWRNETGRYRWFARPRVFALRMVFYRFTGRATRYDAVCATSAFYRDQVFAPAFLARSVPVTGYPRNDFARSLQGAARALAWHNVDREVASKIPGWLDERRRLVLIAPTMRDSSASPVRLDADITEQLDAFATTHGVEFLF